MRQRKKWLATGAVLVALVGLCATTVPSASATAVARCPSDGTPPPGSTIRGGLEVDGFQCNLTGVTVYGGITVDATGAGDFPIGYLSIDGSTVNGGIVVNGGAVDIGADGFYSFNRTFNPTTINGGIKLNDALWFSSADATIRGGLTMNGVRDAVPVFGGGGFFSQMCGTDVSGGVTIRDMSVEKVFLGDPGEPIGYLNGATCDGNTIHGSVLLGNSNFTGRNGEGNEIEGDTITGTVQVDHSTAEVWANTIQGSLFCTNGTIIQPPLPDDPSNANNVVKGANTCT